MYYTQYCFFFTSAGVVDDMLMKLLLIKQIIKDDKQFDEHFIQCQTSTDISGAINEFVQYDQNYLQCIHTHLTHNW